MSIIKNKNSSKPSSFEKLKAYAILNGFALLENSWLGYTTEHRFQHIESGKPYKSTPRNVLTCGFPKDLRSKIDLFNELKTLATEAGFELLEQEWLGVRKKHQFKHIESGKLYNGRPNDIKINGFPKDLRNKIDMYNDFKIYAHKNGFELLENEWLGGKKPHRFKHIESGKLYSGRPTLLGITGFPKDLRTKEDMYNDLKNYASNNGFELLEQAWLGAETNHKFKHLASGKIYEGTPNNVTTRFPVTFDYDFTMLTNLRQSSDKNGFDLIDTEWRGKKEIYKFRHRISGQIYEGRPNSNDFPIDVLNQVSRFNKLTLFSKKHGFKLLEQRWLGESTEHRFQNIRSNEIYQWTPQELRSKKGFTLVAGQRYLTEEVCRQIMTHIFGGDFRSERRRFKDLYNKKMQLDGYQTFDVMPNILTTGGKILAINNVSYTHNLNITEVAFEFQGHQGHFENTNVIERDKLRVKYCQELGILLVVINPPEDWRKTRDSNYMFTHVCAAIQDSITTEKNLQFKPGFEIDLSHWNPDIDEFNKLQALALEHNYELLDTKWLGILEKHKFKNKITGKLYERSPANIYKTGFITSVLTNLEKYENLVNYAKQQGFKLLEEKWLGGLINHRFKHITSGKVYEGKPNTIQCHGFPKDLRNKSDKFKDLYKYAQENGFELLESKWLGSHTKHKFKHIDSGKLYDGCPKHVYKGFPKDLRSDIDKFQELSILAQQNGFELCSTQWMGSDTKHKFKNLTSGLILERSPSNIKNQGFSIKRHLDNTSAVSNNTDSITSAIGNLFFDNVPPIETFMPNQNSAYPVSTNMPDNNLD